MKDYHVKAKPVAGFENPNRYQKDLLYLRTLAEEVVPLEDQYFPPEKRAALERELLQKLGRPDCDRAAFLLCLQEYLAKFNCEHAYIAEDPHPNDFLGRYPFRIHYVSNDLYVSNAASNYDRSIIGQRITAINGQPIEEIEAKLFGFVSAESLCTRRAALESAPCSYSRPDLYQFAGLVSSVSNRIELEFADHSPVWIEPAWNRNIPWHRRPLPRHPITAEAPHQYDCRIFPKQNFAYFQFNACFDKIAILDGLNMVRPWIRPLVRAWLAWQFHRTKPSAVLDGIYDPSRPLFTEYLASAIRDLKVNGITNLIVDLRYNSGGETELTKQFIYHLTHRGDLLDSKDFEYNTAVFAYYDPDQFKEFRAWYLAKFGVEPPSRELLPTPSHPFFHRVEDVASPYHVAPDRPVFEGRIILLVNQDTASAASLLAGLMQDNQLAVLIGTTTGNNPTGPTGMTPFNLPQSGIMVSLPSEYDERAQPLNGQVLQPDYWVEESMEDLFIGRDAVFDKALDLLGVNQTKAGPLSEEDLHGAIEFLKSLKATGRQPGWSAHDKGEAALETYSYFAPKSVTLRIRKQGDRSFYHYTLIRPSEAAGWQMQKAWRTDRKGRTLEQYQLSSELTANRPVSDSP